MRLAILLILSLVVFSSAQPLHADDRPVQHVIPKGTRAYTIGLAKDDKLAAGIRVGVMLDVIAEISAPIKTAVTLRRVELFAVDRNGAGVRSVTVLVTPTQAKVLALLQADGVGLRLQLHDAKKEK